MQHPQPEGRVSLPESPISSRPADPLWKRDYVASVRRLVRDGVDTPLANLFVTAARAIPPEAEDAKRAPSASEAFLYRRLETLPETRGRFQLNTDLPIAFDGFGKMEIDLIGVRPLTGALASAGGHGTPR
jgi:hypothetical protein